MHISSLLFSLLTFSSFDGVETYGAHRTYQTAVLVRDLRPGPGRGEFRVQDEYSKTWRLRPAGQDLQAVFDDADPGGESDPNGWLPDSAAWPAGCVPNVKRYLGRRKDCELSGWQKAPQGEDRLATVRTYDRYEVRWGWAEQDKWQWRTLLVLSPGEKASAAFDGSGQQVAVLDPRNILHVWARRDDATGAASPRTRAAPLSIAHPFTRWTTGFQRANFPPGHPLTSAPGCARSLSAGAHAGQFRLGGCAVGGTGVGGELRLGPAGPEIVEDPVALPKSNDTVLHPGDGRRPTALLRSPDTTGYVLCERKAGRWRALRHIPWGQTLGVMYQGFWLRIPPVVEWEPENYSEEVQPEFFYVKDREEEPRIPPTWLLLDSNGQDRSAQPLGAGFLAHLRSLDAHDLYIYAAPTAPWALLAVDSSWQVLDWSQGRLRVVPQKHPVPAFAPGQGPFQGSSRTALVRFAPDGRQVLLGVDGRGEGMVLYHGQARDEAAGVQLVWTELARLGGIWEMDAAFDSSSLFIGVQPAGDAPYLAALDSILR